MDKILITEKFFATQGEGLHFGTPSIFIRTFGCSLRCQGFGRDHSIEDTTYIDFVDFSQITKLEDTPILDWGCDSPAAIWPEAKHLQQRYSVEELWAEIKTMLPNKSWTTEAGNDIHLIFTGGEPLLPGWQKFYVKFFEYLKSTHNLPKNISFETNCTQKLLPAFEDSVLDLQRYETVFTFCCSPKLSTSGEAFNDRVKLNVLEQYSDYANNIFLKFVVENENQVKEAIDDYVKNVSFSPITYLMPVGGTNEVYMQNKVAIHELAMKYGFRFSSRLQCEVSENKWGT